MVAGVVVLVLVAFTAGVWVDQSFPGYVPNLGGPRSGQIDQATLQQAARIVATNYYDPHLDFAKLSQGSVRGLVDSLNDPFTEYLSPSQYSDQQDAIASKHRGAIGIYVNYKDGYPVVVGVLPGSPALKAGLETDDMILAVDGKDVHGLKAEETSALIRGPVGTKVKLHVRRAAGELDVVVTRSDFQSPTVQSYRFPDSVLYMRVYQFGTNTQSEFDSQLTSDLGGTRAVILDLRNNGGGLVSAAAAMISRFVPSGEAFEVRDRNGTVQRTNVDGNDPAAKLPVVVLVNGNTASASEIVSGSLEAHGRARLVGVKTFGKGSVQVDFVLRDGGALHLTIQHWFLPDGRGINGTGLQPDVQVELQNPTAMFDVVQPSRGHAGDTQLNTALQLLGSPG